MPLRKGRAVQTPNPPLTALGNTEKELVDKIIARKGQETRLTLHEHDDDHSPHTIPLSCNIDVILSRFPTLLNEMFVPTLGIMRQ
jgi:hypothetical protein